MKEDKTEHIDLQEDIILPDHESESTQSNPDRELFSEEHALSNSFFSSERNPVDQEMTSPFQTFGLPLPLFPNPFSNPNPNMAAASSNGKEIGINKPTPFTGDRKKIRTFIQETKVYLTINRDVYDTDEKRIAFMLSYMTDKEALLSVLFLLTILRTISLFVLIPCDVTHNVTPYINVIRFWIIFSVVKSGH